MKHISEIDDELEDFTCSCCDRQFCDKQVEGKKVDYKLLLSWRVTKKFYKCPQCGVNEKNVFWLRKDGIECLNCK